jgi:ATP-dependent DNA helicase RecQ
LKLLYVAPERLTMESFVERLRQTAAFFLAVDEAHCISMWGHDFRPEYRALSLIRQAWPDLPSCLHGHGQSPRSERHRA